MIMTLSMIMSICKSYSSAHEHKEGKGPSMLTDFDDGGDNDNENVVRF